MDKLGSRHYLTWLWNKKESLIWIAALAVLAISNPSTHHYSLCPLDNLGIPYCPGCGLGRSIGYFFRMEFVNSFLSHPLGIPAVFLLIYRTVSILIKPNKLKLSTT